MGIDKAVDRGPKALGLIADKLLSCPCTNVMSWVCCICVHAVEPEWKQSAQAWDTSGHIGSE